MNNREQNLAKVVRGGGICAAGDLLSLVSLTLIGIFLAQLCGSASNFGRFEFAYRLVFFFSFTTTIGLSGGMKRFVPIYQAEKNDAALKGLLLSSIRFVTLASIVVVVILVFAAPWFSRKFDAEGTVVYIRILALFLPFYGLGMLVFSSLTAIHQAEYAVIANKIVVPVIRLLILGAFMLVVNQDLRNAAVMWNLSIASAAGLAVAFVFFLRKFPVLTDNTIAPVYHHRELLKFSLPIALALPVFYLVNHVGVFIIKYFLTFDDLGKFAIAIRLSPLVAIPLLSINTVFSPMISELHHLNRHDELEKHFKFISKWVFAFSLYISLVIVLLNKPILTIFGTSFRDQTTQITLVVLVLAQLFNASVGSVGMLIMMTGRQRVILYNTIALLIVNAAICFVLVPLTIPIGGIIGAGIAQAAAIIGINAVYLLQVRRYLKMHPFSIGYMKPIIAALLSTAMVFGIMYMSGMRTHMWDTLPKTFLEYGALGGWIILFALMLGLLYALFIYFLGLDDSDKFILRLIVGRIRSIGSSKNIPNATDE